MVELNAGRYFLTEALINIFELDSNMFGENFHLTLSNQHFYTATNPSNAVNIELEF